MVESTHVGTCLSTGIRPPRVSCRPLPCAPSSRPVSARLRRELPPALLCSAGSLPGSTHPVLAPPSPTVDADQKAAPLASLPRLKGCRLLGGCQRDLAKQQGIEDSRGTLPLACSGTESPQLRPLCDVRLILRKGEENGARGCQSGSRGISQHITGGGSREIYGLLSPASGAPGSLSGQGRQARGPRGGGAGAGDAPGREQHPAKLFLRRAAMPPSSTCRPRQGTVLRVQVGVPRKGACGAGGLNLAPSARTRLSSPKGLVSRSTILTWISEVSQ